MISGEPNHAHRSKATIATEDAVWAPPGRRAAG